MKKVRVWGIDISTMTGIVTADLVEGTPEIREILTVKHGKHDVPIERATMFGDDVLELLDKDGTPDLVLIEGYATGSRGMSTQIIEVSAIIKFCLNAKGIDWIEIPPNTLKVFASNNGQAKKDLMLKQVYKLWGADLDDDNQADAYALMMMGMNLLGVDCVPEKHTRCWDKIRPHVDFVRNLERLNKLQLVANSD